MSSDTDFHDLDDDISKAAIADPSIDATVAEMWAEQARHRSGLAAIRSVVGLTQEELAAALGVSQSAIAQQEARGDLMASTLIRNLAVLDAEVVVRFRDSTEVLLSELLSPGTNDQR